jgi:hypothetical protein
MKGMIDVSGIFSQDGYEIICRLSKFFPRGSTLAAVADGLVHEGLLPNTEHLRIWSIRDHAFDECLTDFREVVTANQIRFDVICEPNIQGSDMLAAVVHAQNDGILKFMERCPTSGVTQGAMREAAPHARGVSEARQLEEG